jgi:hypothetical protein
MTIGNYIVRFVGHPQQELTIAMRFERQTTVPESVTYGTYITPRMLHKIFFLSSFLIHITIYYLLLLSCLHNLLFSLSCLSSNFFFSYLFSFSNISFFFFLVLSKRKKSFGNISEWIRQREVSVNHQNALKTWHYKRLV